MVVCLCLPVCTSLYIYGVFTYLCEVDFWSGFIQWILRLPPGLEFYNYDSTFLSVFIYMSVYIWDKGIPCLYLLHCTCLVALQVSGKKSPSLCDLVRVRQMKDLLSCLWLCLELSKLRNCHGVNQSWYQLWWFILCVNLCGPQGVQIFGKRLFRICLRAFGDYINTSISSLIEQSVLPIGVDLHLISWKPE